MKKKKFDELAEALYARGYKKYSQQWHHEDYVIGKSFLKEDNKWEEDRPQYQLLVSVYDYSDKSKEMYSRIPKEMKNTVGLEVHVDMSRTIDERLDMTFAWHEEDTIEEIERIASGFFYAMCILVPEPRKEK